MQADVVIAFTLLVDLMSLDAREGTAEEENVFESRIDSGKIRMGEDEGHGFVYIRTRDWIRM